MSIFSMTSQLKRIERCNQKWDRMKQDVLRIYCEEGETLEVMVAMIEEIHQFKAR